MQDMIQLLAKELEKPVEHVQNVVTLIDEGNTIPFIARYRKEMHGAMDDTVLRTLEERLGYLRNLESRREEVKKSIEGQDKLTEELTAQIDGAKTLAEVEDLYRPYKQKRRTRATIAKEKGLEPLALQLFSQEKNLPEPEALALPFLDAEKGVETVEDALAGASDIIAELVSDSADIRRKLRELILRRGLLKSEATKEEDSVYHHYYAFEQPLPKMQGHQVLAINRGEKEEFLKVSVVIAEDMVLNLLAREFVKAGSSSTEFVRTAVEDGYRRLLQPSMEREIRNTLTDMAAEGAIHNFALNLKPLLMQPPVKGHVTMGRERKHHEATCRIGQNKISVSYTHLRRRRCPC